MINKLHFCTLSLIVIALLVWNSQQKKKTKQRLHQEQVALLGENHTFSLVKYQKPQQFVFEISCNQPAVINFELSQRLKRLHKNIFLNVDFELHSCIKSTQDTRRVIVDDESWDLILQFVCCNKKNATKVINETIKVTVRDGFKIFGLPIKTKYWNAVMAIITSFCICLFTWFSNFSQPRADNIGFLTRFYKQKNAPIKQQLNIQQTKQDKKLQNQEKKENEKRK